MKGLILIPLVIFSNITFAKDNFQNNFIVKMDYSYDKAMWSDDSLAYNHPDNTIIPQVSYLNHTKTCPIKTEDVDYLYIGDVSKNKCNFPIASIEAVEGTIELYCDMATSEFASEISLSLAEEQKCGK